MIKSYVIPVPWESFREDKNGELLNNFCKEEINKIIKNNNLSLLNNNIYWKFIENGSLEIKLDIAEEKKYNNGLEEFSVIWD